METVEAFAIIPEACGPAFTFKNKIKQQKPRNILIGWNNVFLYDRRRQKLRETQRTKKAEIVFQLCC